MSDLPSLVIALPKKLAPIVLGGKDCSGEPILVQLLRNLGEPGSYRLIDEHEIHQTSEPVFAPLHLVGPPGRWLGKKEEWSVSGGKFTSSIFEKMSKTQLQLLQSDRVIPAFDNISEGPDMGAWWVERFQEKLLEFRIPVSRTLFLTQNTNAETGRRPRWFKNAGTDAIIPFSMHASLIRVAMDMRANFSDALEDGANIRRHALSTAHGTVNRPNTFLCLNRRLKAHRLALVLHLLRKGYDRRALVSMIEAADNEFLSNQLQKIMSAKDIGELLSFWKADPGLLPRNLDLTVENAYNTPNKIHRPVTSLFMDTYFSVVTESNFHGGKVFRFTEKTWKPIVMYHPFILVGPAGLLQELKRLGFRTFHPVINESYDTEIDDRIRFSMILTEIDRLAELPQHKLQQVYADLWPRVEHNHFHFFDLAPKYLSEQLDRLRTKVAGLI